MGRSSRWLRNSMWNTPRRRSRSRYASEGGSKSRAYSLQDILLAELASDMNPEDDPLRSKLGHVLLHNHGEYILPLGCHPTPEERLAIQEGPSPTSPTGQGRKIASRAELNKLLARLQTNAKAVNAELFELYVNENQGNTNGVYGCWMLRWMPKSAEEIVEVRVAVVGNVDAGKSTMLGMSSCFTK